MWTIVRKPLRDLRALGGRGLALAAMMALGIGVAAGAPMSRASLHETRDALYRELLLSDLVIEVVPVTDEELPPLGSVAGVAASARRYVAGNFLELSDGTSAAALVVHLEHPAGSGVDEIRIVEGRLFRDDETDAVVVDNNFARRNGLHAGDTVFLETLGSPRPVRVVGIGFSPEFLMASANPNLLLPVKGSLAVLFAPMRALSDAFGYALYNSLTFRYAPGADGRAVEESILARLDGVHVQRVTRREQAFVYRLLESGLKAFDIFIPAAIALLEGLAFLGTLLVVDRIVRRQERELAALSALGMRPWEIAASVLLLAGALAAAAVVPGMALARVVRDLAADAYAGPFGFPELVRPFSVRAVLAAAAFTVVLALVAALRPAVRAALRPPQRGIRETRSRPAALHAVDVALGRVVSSVAGRAALRGLLRRPGSTLATVVGIACAAGSAIAFRGSLASFEHAGAGLIAREHWDVAIDFRVPLDADDTARITRTPGLAHTEPYLRGFCTADLPTGTEDYVVVGLPPNLSLRRLTLASGRDFSSPDAREAILNRGYGAARGIALGDRIGIRSAKRRVDVVVVGLLSDASVGELYVPLEVAREVLTAPGGASGLFATVDAPLEGVLRELHRTSGVARVFDKADLRAGVAEYIRLARAEADVASGLQLVIAVLLVFTTLQLHIDERERDFAILRILGHRARTIAGIAFLEVFVVGAVGLLLSLPVGRGLADFLVASMSAAWVDMPLVLTPVDYLTVVLLTFALLPFAAAPGIRRVLTRDLASVTGERELA